MRRVFVEGISRPTRISALKTTSFRRNKSRGSRAPLEPISVIYGFNSIRWEFRYSSETVDRSPIIASPAGMPAARVTG